MESKEIQIQKILIDYFKDFDDETIIKVIESFVYEINTDDERIIKIIDKFLSDNFLTNAYNKYSFDKTSNSYFKKISNSELQILEYVKNGFLNLAYNRLRISVYELKLEKIKNKIDNLQIKENKKTKKVKKQIDYNKVKLSFDNDGSDVHLIINENYTLCGILIDGDYTHNVEIGSTENITCEHCLDIINQCKATKI